ncbi:MAG: hypothetical protein RLW61_12955 [Gammaproteobacteria bacterium]
MNEASPCRPNTVLLQAACLWILLALVLAWCLVGLAYRVDPLLTLFPGKYTRVLQAHLDLLIMSALLLGFYASRVALPWPSAWAMAIGAFTNSSLFLLMALFPTMDPSVEQPAHWSQDIYEVYQFMSLSLTTFGFTTAAIWIFRSTLHGTTPTQDAAIQVGASPGDAAQ